MFYSSFAGSDRSIPLEYAPLYDYIVEGNLKGVSRLIEPRSRALRTAVISDSGEIALHVAVSFNRVNVVNYLVGEMDPRELEKTRHDGKTALALTGNVEIAKCLTKKNDKLALILTNGIPLLPVVLAVLNRADDMAKFLYGSYSTYVDNEDNEIKELLRINSAALLNLSIRLRNFGEYILSTLIHKLC